MFIPLLLGRRIRNDDLPIDLMRRPPRKSRDQASMTEGTQPTTKTLESHNALVIPMSDGYAVAKKEQECRVAPGIRVRGQVERG